MKAHSNTLVVYYIYYLYLDFYLLYWLLFALVFCVLTVLLPSATTVFCRRLGWLRLFRPMRISTLFV